MSSPSTPLHPSLLRPSILHILRAAGFHSTRPSVLDTLTDLYIRHFSLLAAQTAAHAHATHPSTPAPTLADVRAALRDAGALSYTLTAGEEAALERAMAAEAARAHHAAATLAAGQPQPQPQQSRHDAAATRDVREFVAWARGPANAEIRRVAGVAGPGGAAVVVAAAAAAGEGGEKEEREKAAEREDWLEALRRKTSKSGDEGRFVGTVLGRGTAEGGAQVRIEGGPETLGAWRRGVVAGRGGGERVA